MLWLLWHAVLKCRQNAYLLLIMSLIVGIRSCCRWGGKRGILSWKAKRESIVYRSQQVTHFLFIGVIYLPMFWKCSKLSFSNYAELCHWNRHHLFAPCLLAFLLVGKLNWVSSGYRWSLVSLREEGGNPTPPTLMCFSLKAHSRMSL